MFPASSLGALAISHQVRIVSEEMLPNQSAREDTTPWLNSGDQLETTCLAAFFSRH